MALAEASVKKTEKYAKDSIKIMKLQQQSSSSDNTLHIRSENIKNSQSQLILRGKKSFSKREQLLTTKLQYDSQFRKNQRVFAQLVDRLESRLEFLDIEDMRSLVKKMTAAEAEHNRIGLKKLKENIDYQLQCGSEDYVVEEHAVESATLLIR